MGNKYIINILKYSLKQTQIFRSEIFPRKVLNIYIKEELYKRAVVFEDERTLNNYDLKTNHF